MKSPKNRKKAFRVHCANCHATQDSLRFACSQCNHRLYANMEADEMKAICDQVEAMEQSLDGIEGTTKQKAKPYEGMDQAWVTYRALRQFHYLPGMTAYLDRILEVLLPIKLRLMQRTVKANWIFMGVMVTFPLVTLIFGLHPMVTGLLALPAVVWLLVTFKAIGDLRKTKAKLDQITTS